MHILQRERFFPLEEEAVNRDFTEYNQSQGHASPRQGIALAAYSPDDELIGALDGYLFFDWLTVSRLWVVPAQRNSGIGRRLLAEAEAQARRGGCVGSTLSTYDFQARPFYEKQGDQVFGVLADNPKGHERFFKRKTL